MPCRVRGIRYFYWKGTKSWTSVDRNLHGWPIFFELFLTPIYLRVILWFSVAFLTQSIYTHQQGSFKEATVLVAANLSERRRKMKRTQLHFSNAKSLLTSCIFTRKLFCAFRRKFNTLLRRLLSEISKILDESFSFFRVKEGSSRFSTMKWKYGFRAGNGDLPLCSLSYISGADWPEGLGASATYFSPNEALRSSYWLFLAPLGLFNGISQSTSGLLSNFLKYISKITSLLSEGLSPSKFGAG